jgi:hypothetical protein
MVQNDHQKTALNLPIHFVPFTWSQFSKEINLVKHIKWSHMQECMSHMQECMSHTNFALESWKHDMGFDVISLK